jgi:hypothetical protein
MKKNVPMKVALIAAFSVAALGQANAQIALGEDCGCPPLNARTSVDMSSLTQANGNLTNATTTLTCNNTYRLDELVYVQDGAKLLIQAGTIVRGVFGEDADANALVVARGGQIFATGTDHCPIIFTAESDPLDGTYSVDIRGQWGGLIILGKAPNNLLLADGGLAVGNGVGTIEGLFPGDPRNQYGGTEPNDNSGVMRYVSIRHGGTNIGADNEINGLTMGSVGRGTTLEYIEVIANQDDAFEFFGGTVDLKYATAAYSGDDYFDYDQGYTGRNQFLLAVQLGGASPQGDRGFEADGDDSNSGNTPFTSPTIYNATLIGRGVNRGINTREGFGGRISNSIIASWDVGVDIANEAGRPFDSFQLLLSGNLKFTNNAFDAVNDIVRVNNAAAPASVTTIFTNDGNTIESLIDFENTIDIITNVVSNPYNAVPAAGTASSPESAPIDDFFSPAFYKGAFKPGTLAPWTANWTLSALLEADASLIACPTDINRDGQTDVIDFLELNSAFGTSCGN